MSPESLKANVRGLAGPTLALLAAILLAVAGIFATLVVSVRSLDSTSRASRAAADINRRSLQLERIAVDLEPGARGYMPPHDRRFLEPYDKGRAVIGARTRELVRLSAPAERPLAQRIRVDLTDYVQSYTE